MVQKTVKEELVLNLNEIIPKDVKKYVLSLLTTPKDLWTVKLVCKEWNELVVDPVLW